MSNTGVNDFNKYPFTQTGEDIQKILDKVGGIATGATKTQRSEKNGCVIINGVEEVVYSHPTNGGDGVHLPNIDEKINANIYKNFLKISQNITKENPEYQWSPIYIDDINQLRNTTKKVDALKFKEISKTELSPDNTMEGALMVFGGNGKALYMGYDGCSYARFKVNPNTTYLVTGCATPFNMAPFIIYADSDRNMVGIDIGESDLADFKQFTDYKTTTPDIAGLTYMYVNNLTSFGDIAVYQISETLVVEEINFGDTAVSKIEEMAQKSANNALSDAEEYTNESLSNVKGEMTEYTDEVKTNTVKSILQKASNTLRHRQSGQVVSIKDVSPLEHTIDCCIVSRNRIAYPYAHTSDITSGITIETDSDGVITVDGTSSGSTNYSLSSPTSPTFLEAGLTYTLSMTCDDIPDGNSTQILVQKINDDGSLNPAICQITPKNPIDNFTADGEKYRIMMSIKADTYANTKFKIQITEGVNTTGYIPYVNPTTTTVKVFGKNWFNKNDYTKSNCNVPTSTTNATYQVTADRSVVIQVAPNTTYTIKHSLPTVMRLASSVDIPAKGGAITNLVLRDKAETGSLTITTGSNDSYLLIQLLTNDDVTEGYTVEQCVKSLQVEVGDIATEYEEFIPPVEYSAEADGSVNGIVRIFPHMTFVNDTQNTMVICKYNKDINKAFEEIYNAIISLGGNV